MKVWGSQRVSIHRYGRERGVTDTRVFSGEKEGEEKGMSGFIDSLLEGKKRMAKGAQRQIYTHPSLYRRL